MTIGRTNSGSGGGLSANAAVLAVTTFVGASVTITNGSTSKTKDATKAHVIDTDNDMALYIFSIGQSQFGTWTVAVTSDGITQTKTIAITAVEFYEITVRARVPDEYQEVEYLTATGTQRIEVADSSVSSYSSSSTYKATFKMLLTNVSDTRHMCGSKNDNTSTRWSILMATDKRYWYGESNHFANITGINANTIYYTEMIIDKGTSTLKMNDVNKASATVSKMPTDANLCIFTIASTESSQYNGKGNIYYFLFEVDGVKQNECIPCYRKSDSVAGMYDRITGTFNTNQGTGTFGVGSDVN